MSQFEKEYQLVKSRLENSNNIVQIIESKKLLDTFVAKYMAIMSPMDLGFIQICRDLKRLHEQKFLKITNSNLTT